MMDGNDFNYKAVLYTESIETVTFSKWWNYSSMFKWEDGIIVDENGEGTIRAFLSDDKKTLYVLSEDKIYLNPDCSQMLSHNDSLLKVNFYNTDASQVTTMEKMFSGCSKLKTVYTKGLNTPNLVSMKEMFRDCVVLESISLPTFDTSKVTDMSYMFNGCYSLYRLNISSFDTSKVFDMSEMFAYSNNLSKIYVSNKWTTANVTDSEDMFLDCTALVGGNGTKYDANKITASYACIDTASKKGYLTLYN